MSSIERFDFDKRMHHGVVDKGTVYPTGQVGTPDRHRRRLIGVIAGERDGET